MNAKQIFVSLCFFLAASSLLFFSFTNYAPPASSKVLFTISCIDEHTIRVSAAGEIDPSISAPSSYFYNLYLEKVFKDGMISQSLPSSISVTGCNDNFLHTNAKGDTSLIGNVGNITSNILATRMVPGPYGLLFIASPRTPGLLEGGKISGYVDIYVSYPNHLSLKDILKDCGEKGDIIWGDTTRPDYKVIGEWQILCPCPCS